MVRIALISGLFERGIEVAAGGCPEHSQEGALCTPESATRQPTSPREGDCSMGMPGRVE
jgi:hypothetical protein